MAMDFSALFDSTNKKRHTPSSSSGHKVNLNGSNNMSLDGSNKSSSGSSGEQYSQSQFTDLPSQCGSLVSNDNSRMSTSNEEVKQEEEEDEKKNAQTTLPPPPLCRMQSKALPGGQLMHYYITPDAELEMAEYEQRKAALTQNMDIRKVREEYRTHTTTVLTDFQVARRVQRQLRSDSDGVLEACRKKTQQDIARDVNIGRIRTGVIRVKSYEEYYDTVLPLAAQDVTKGTLLTLYETPSLSLGVCLCVRLRYGSFVRMANSSDFDMHIKTAQQLAQACFPHENSRLFVAACCPRLKDHTRDPDHNLPKICNSLQLVWPHILIRDVRYVQIFWTTLALRIRENNPFFADIVDHTVLNYKNATLRLRTLYSHKTTRCTSCVQNQQQQQRRRTTTTTDPYESSSSDEEDTEESVTAQHQQLIGCTCIQGKQVAPFAYKPYGFVEHSTKENDDEEEVFLIDKTTFSEQTGEKLQHLQCMSIVVRDLQMPSARFVPPLDAPLPADCAQLSSKLYAAEQKEHAARMRGRGNEIVDAQTFPDVYQLCTSIVRLVDPQTYQFVVASRVTFQHAKKMVFVSVSGKNVCFCHLKADNTNQTEDHHVHFVIQPLQYLVSAHCYNSECRRILTIRSKRRMLERTKKKRKTSNITTVAYHDAEDLDDFISPVHEDALKKMEAYISYDSGFREPLFAAMGLVYTGKTKSSIRIAQTPPVQPYLAEPTAMDKETGMELPRSLLERSLEDKIAFLKTKKEQELPNFISGPKVIAFVTPCKTNLLDSYWQDPPILTKEQLRENYRRQCNIHCELEA